MCKTRRVSVHVHVILFKLGKPLALRLLFKVPRNTKYKKTTTDLRGGESKIDDEVHVASEIYLNSNVYEFFREQEGFCTFQNSHT